MVLGLLGKNNLNLKETKYLGGLVSRLFLANCVTNNRFTKIY